MHIALKQFKTLVASSNSFLINKQTAMLLRKATTYKNQLQLPYRKWLLPYLLITNFSTLQKKNFLYSECAHTSRYYLFTSIATVHVNFPHAPAAGWAHTLKTSEEKCKHHYFPLTNTAAPKPTVLYCARSALALLHQYYLHRSDQCCQTDRHTAAPFSLTEQEDFSARGVETFLRHRWVLIFFPRCLIKLLLALTIETCSD